MRRLLILACSDTKKGGEQWMPARDRYDGPLWQTLRAVDSSERHAQVGFVSARYGFREARDRIEAYNSRFTRESAAAMIRGGLNARWPVEKRKALRYANS